VGDKNCVISILQFWFHALSVNKVLIDFLMCIIIY